MAPCHWCRKSLNLKQGTRDHVVPRSAGGGSAIGNLVLACKPCNNQRGDFPFEEYEALWAQLRKKAITVEEFEETVAAKKFILQFQRNPEITVRRKRVNRGGARCELCKQRDCSPGLHRIYWLGSEYCPWCWALACSPATHRDDLKRT